MIYTDYQLRTAHEIIVPVIKKIYIYLCIHTFLIYVYAGQGLILHVCDFSYTVSSCAM